MMAPLGSRRDGLAVTVPTKICSASATSCSKSLTTAGEAAWAASRTALPQNRSHPSSNPRQTKSIPSVDGSHRDVAPDGAWDAAMRERPVKWEHSVTRSDSQ